MSERPFYLEMLHKHFEARHTRNPRYSLRSYARDLQFNPSRLSEVLNRKKGLSAEAAEGLTRRLGLNSSEREHFVLSARALHARSARERLAAGEMLKRVQAASRAMRLRYDEFEGAHNWYHLALLELIELRDCDHSPEWFAKKLGLSPAAVKQVLERLLAIGWLVHENGVYRASFETSETAYDVPSLSVKRYHEQILEKAGKALFTDESPEREFLTMTLAFATHRLPAAKEAIRRFQRDFARDFYDPAEAKDSVYQLSLQLFRLDAKTSALQEKT